MALVSGRIAPCRLSGSFLSNNFLSDPMRLVKSQGPLPFPSPFEFSQILKETPQFLIAFTRTRRCLSLRWLGGLSKFSSLSHSRASLLFVCSDLSDYSTLVVYNNRLELIKIESVVSAGYLLSEHGTVLDLMT